MRTPLAVRIKADGTDRHVTREVRGLRFRRVAPGGFHSASCRVLAPREDFPTLGPNDQLFIYDRRNGQTVWDGYTERPGPTSGPAGQGWDLTATGGMVTALDRAERLIYIDQELENWAPDEVTGSLEDTTGEVANFPMNAGTRSGRPALMMRFPKGLEVPAGGGIINMRYPHFETSIMAPGAMQFFHDGGRVSTYMVRASFVNPTMGTTEAVLAGGGNLVGIIYKASDNIGEFVTFQRSTSAAAISNFHGSFSFEASSADGYTVGTSGNWWGVGEIKILGQMVDRNGQWYANPRSNYVLASEVAEDLLGRLLVSCDPNAATIEATSYQIDQLAYLDAVPAAAVLDDLSLVERGFLWEILEVLPSGKHRFNYRAWGGLVRYEITLSDGYSAPGGEDEAANRVAVNWTGYRGASRVTVVTSDAPTSLTRPIRDAEPVSLPDSLGSPANAQRIGELVLDQSATPARSATAKVQRPLRDRLTGSMVMPWEISPGYYVRVRETGEVLRLTEVEFSDEEAAATLSLGDPVRTVEQEVARLRRPRARRRR